MRMMLTLHHDFGEPELGVDTHHSEFVPVLFAGNIEEARQYKSLLDGHNIPVLLESERGEDKIYGAFAKAIPVLVPDRMHDHATDLVAEIERNGAGVLRCVEDDDDLDDEDDVDDIEDDDDIDEVPDVLEDDFDEPPDDDDDDDDDDDGLDV